MKKITKKLYGVLLLLILSTTLFANTGVSGVDALSIIRKLDRDSVYSSIKYSGEIFIEISGRKFVKTFEAYAQGNNNSYLVFTNTDDMGTKYLKQNGKLFMYSPDVEDVIPITGHMLKESMMGSDMSYEDTIDNETLESQYNATIVEDTVFEGKNVFVLELISKRQTVTYPKLKIWVEKDGLNSIKLERYALSGVLLKEERVLRKQKIGGRDFPVEVTVKDMLRNNSSTRFVMKSVELDVKIPPNTFSMQNLMN